MPQRHKPDSRLVFVAELHTLSAPRLCAPGGGDLLGPGKPLALLVYLACSPRRSAGREHLMDLLWSDLAPEKARHSLRQTLWYLRQQLPEGIEAAGNEIRLTLNLRFDRDEFLEALGQGALEAAIAAYKQDFLAGFAVPGGLEFEQWADVERQRLRAACLRAIEQLTRRQLDAGQFRDGIALARRGRDAASGTERMWRLLLEALAAARDQIGFAVESSALRALLAQDGRAPEPATAELLRRLEPEGPGQVTGAPSALNPDLIGREQQFSAILGAWEEAREHHGCHLRLEAGAGLGKSRLLTEVYQRLRSRGSRVVAVRATPGDRAIPFSFAAEIARALAKLPGAAGVSRESAAALVALNPTLSAQYAVPPDTASGLEAVRRRSSALKELLNAVSDEQTCALLLDDLHWADGTSLRVLRPLLERVGEQHALVVTAARPGSGAEGTLEGAETIALPPLSVAQVDELLGNIAPLPAEAWAADLPALLHQATGGVPLLLLETLQLAIERGRLALVGGAWSCPAWAVFHRELCGEGALRQRVSRLEGETGRLLLALAVAGNPLTPGELAGVLGWDLESTERQLLVLEHRGLGQRVGDHYQAAHDEIAALALELSDEGSRREIHGALGRTTAAEARGTLDLVRAGRHLAVAARWPELRAVFLRYVRLLRREGDSRRLRNLASDFLEGFPEASSHELLRTLGRLNRVRYDIIRAPVVIGGVAVVAGGAALLAVTRPPGPDAVLVIRDRQASPAAVRRVPLSAQRWKTGEAIDLRTIRTEPLPGNLTRVNSFLPGPRPDLWTADVETGDSTNTIDIMLVDGRGGARPFVSGRRDDDASSWLPDGSGVAITSARHSLPGADDYDVGVATLDGRLHWLSQTPDHDVEPRVSPDGTRVAFVRQQTHGSPEYCTQAIAEPPAPYCIPALGRLLPQLVGWTENLRLLVLEVTPDGLRDLLAIDPASGRREALLHEVLDATASPSGQWLAFQWLPPGRNHVAWFVARTDTPLEARELAVDPAWGRLEIRWQESRVHYLDRVTLERARDSLPTQVAHQLAVTATDLRGKPLDLPLTYRWSSSDTSVATVDSTGLLLPRQQGSTLVTVSAGGWRHDTATFLFRAGMPRTVLTEDWRKGFTSLWSPYGSPAPVIVRDSSGKAWLWNRGDGSYGSGAYTARVWDGRDGIGVEVEFSAKLTMPRAQQLMVELIGGLDVPSLRAWDHKTGGLPNAGLALRSCAVEYPAGEGPQAVDQIAFVAGGIQIVVPAGHRLDRGRVARMRLQIFPDGTCGGAIDGQAIWRSRVSLPLDESFGVNLGYASSGTRMLHGPLEVWTGVRPDIVWPALGFQAQ